MGVLYFSLGERHRNWETQKFIKIYRILFDFTQIYGIIIQFISHLFDCMTWDMMENLILEVHYILEDSF